MERQIQIQSSMKHQKIQHKHKKTFEEIYRIHKKQHHLKEAKMKFINNERIKKYAKERILA